MSSDYRKYTVPMEYAAEGFRLWKHGVDRAVCVLETYREKRSVYFAVSNLLPSRLLSEQKKEYHLMLLGASDGELIHRDFGTFTVNQSGEGSFFKKFGGAPLSAYTHCLLAAAGTDGTAETVLSGKTPFFTEPEEVSKTEAPDRDEDPWRTLFDRCQGEGQREVFSEEIDETGAVWWRMEAACGLPESLDGCRALTERYGHFLVGKGCQSWFIAVPGRFLLAEQPMADAGCFQLWQPIRGGEAFFGKLEDLSGQAAESLFGYWIGAVDEASGKILAI